MTRLHLTPDALHHRRNVADLVTLLAIEVDAFVLGTGFVENPATAAAYLDGQVEARVSPLACELGGNELLVFEFADQSGVDFAYRAGEGFGEPLFYASEAVGVVAV